LKNPTRFTNLHGNRINIEGVFSVLVKSGEKAEKKRRKSGEKARKSGEKEEKKRRKRRKSYFLIFV